MNTEELKDIIECILMFDSTATDMQKARYFDIIQKDLKRVVKLLATPAVSNRRELLIAFYNHTQKNKIDHNIPQRIEKMVDSYLSNL